MTEIIANHASYDEGAAYGVILLEDGHKDAGYASGPWTPQNALLFGINQGLAAASNPKARVHLPDPQIANYVRAGLIERWKESDWHKLNGTKVEPKAAKQWNDLVQWREELDLEFDAPSDHPLLEWARKCALCAVAEVNVRALRPQSELEEIQTVTEAQASNFWMTANDVGHTEQSARRLLSDYGVISAKDLPRSEYDSAMERVSSEALVDKYARDRQTADSAPSQ